MTVVTAVPLRQTDLITPGFPVAIVAAIDQEACGAAECIVRGAIRRDAAVVVEIDPHVQPYLRHPLGVSHGAGPGADHLLRVTPAAFDDDQSVEQLAFPVVASARLTP